MRRGYAIQPMDVTVVVPTSGRAGYLEVALDSLRGQRTNISHELLVIDDGSTDRTPEVAGRFGARVVRHGERRSLNAARNTGLREARGELIAFVDDDVYAPPRLAGRARGGGEATPRRRGLRRADPGALRGSTRRAAAAARIRRSRRSTWERRTGRPRWCGARTSPSGARRWTAIGEFDESFDRGHGDEEEWLMRLRAAGGRIVYLADAGLDHRRAAGDSGLASLARAAYHRGRGARSSDSRHGKAPRVARELRNVAGAGWHTVRRACPQG